MKAKIKATGEIVHVGDYNTISHDPMYKNERTGPWRLEELDFSEPSDYWTRLKHQYAGMAMQGMIRTVGHDRMYPPEKIAIYAEACAYALIQKQKEKEERK